MDDNHHVESVNTPYDASPQADTVGEKPSTDGSALPTPAKISIIRQLCSTVSGPELTMSLSQLAISKGGFLNDELRRIVCKY